MLFDEWVDKSGLILHSGFGNFFLIRRFDAAGALTLMKTSLILTFLLGALALPASAATFVLGARFASDGPPGAVIDSSYGFATLSYTASSALANGSYSLGSFTDLQIQINIGEFTFTQAHLVSDINAVHVEVRDGGFTFSNSLVPGLSTAYGSADFVIGKTDLSTQPVAVGNNSGVRYIMGDENGTISGGFYMGQAVPEPSAVLLGMAGVALFAGRRRRAASVAG